MKKLFKLVMTVVAVSVIASACTPKDKYAELRKQINAATEAKDTTLMLKLLTEGAGKGDTMSIQKLAALYEHGINGKVDTVKALAYYRMGAEMGSADCQNILGYFFHYGDLGTTINADSALYWYNKAFAQGEPYSRINIATCYMTGFGVKEDVKKGFSMYLESVKDSIPVALHDLGLCYSDGIGVKKDLKLAKHYYQLAADKEHADAECNLACLLLEGVGDAKPTAADTVAAFKYFERSVNHGSMYCLSNLAECYQKGYGVKMDVKKAFDLYTQSAELGYKESLDSLKNPVFKEFK